MNIKTNVISVEEAIKSGHYYWSMEDHETFHEIDDPDCLYAFTIELTDGNEFKYTDVVYTRDYEDIVDSPHWYLEADSVSTMVAYYKDICPEFKPTGNIVFRGYYEDYYDPDEHEYFVKPYFKGAC